MVFYFVLLYTTYSCILLRVGRHVRFTLWWVLRYLHGTILGSSSLNSIALIGQLSQLLLGSVYHLCILVVSWRKWLLVFSSPLILASCKTFRFQAVVSTNLNQMYDVPSKDTYHSNGKKTLESEDPVAFGSQSLQLSSQAMHQNREARYRGQRRRRQKLTMYICKSPARPYYSFAFSFYTVLFLRTYVETCL